MRLCALALALTVQGAVTPEADMDAQLTFDVAGAGGQSLGEGVIVILPEAPAEPELMLALLNPYKQAAPDCETAKLVPPSVKFPLRLAELGLTLTDPDAVLPE